MLVLVCPIVAPERVERSSFLPLQVREGQRQGATSRPAGVDVLSRFACTSA
jgi:hypothetical protein